MEYDAFFVLSSIGTGFIIGILTRFDKTQLIALGSSIVTFFVLYGWVLSIINTINDPSIGALHSFFAVFIPFWISFVLGAKGEELANIKPG